MGVVVGEKIKGSGEYWVAVYRNGGRVSKKIGSQEAAEKVAKILEAKLALGLELFPPKKHVPTLKDYFEKYDETYLVTAVRPNTRDMYHTSFNRILPTLGHKRLDQITRSDVTDLIAAWVKKGYAKTTIRITLAQWGSMMNHAIEHKLIEENPTKNTAKYYKQAPTKHKDLEPLTPEEVVLFLEASLEHCPQHYPMFLTAIHTGMRSGELAGLQWGDISFEGKYLTVRRSFSHARISKTKSSKERRVDLSDAVLAVLHQHKRNKRKEWLRKGVNEIQNDKEKVTRGDHVKVTHPGKNK